jgi:hypothetical protein
MKCGWGFARERMVHLQTTCMSQIAAVPSLDSLHDLPAFKRAKANLATRGAETNIDEAFRMVDTFARYGANSFVVTKTELEWPGHKKAKWGKHDSLESLREKSAAIVRTAAIRHPVKIPDYVRDQGRVTTRQMVREFGASPNTLKATFTSLIERGLLMGHGAGSPHLVRPAMMDSEESKLNAAGSNQQLT